MSATTADELPPLRDFVAMAIPGVVPAIPLAATVMPVSEIMKGLLKLPV